MRQQRPAEGSHEVTVSTSGADFGTTCQNLIRFLVTLPHFLQKFAPHISNPFINSLTEIHCLLYLLNLFALHLALAFPLCPFMADNHGYSTFSSFFTKYKTIAR